ncbi:MAG: hypothetical protein JO184_00895 [Gammaproteobacteria bacterium]|nr:hypothetical protein [Gammaproteobacteria bacterium]
MTSAPTSTRSCCGAPARPGFSPAENAKRVRALLSRSWLGVTYALCGDRARAEQKLDELRTIAKGKYIDPVTFAGIHAALGDTDDALREYEQAFADRSPNMVYAVVIQHFDAVGETPRFKAIVARMKFPRGPI